MQEQLNLSYGHQYFGHHVVNTIMKLVLQHREQHTLYTFMCSIHVLTY